VHHGAVTSGGQQRLLHGVASSIPAASPGPCGDFVYNSGNDTSLASGIGRGAHDEQLQRWRHSERQRRRSRGLSVIAAGTLPVTIAYVETVPAGSSLRVRFTTASESGNAGFPESGGRTRGKTSLLATLKSQGRTVRAAAANGGRRCAAPGLPRSRSRMCRLMGRNRVHGPVRGAARWPASSPEAARTTGRGSARRAGLVTALDRCRGRSGRPGADRGARGRDAEWPPAQSAVPPGRSRGGATRDPARDLRESCGRRRRSLRAPRARG